MRSLTSIDPDLRGGDEDHGYYGGARNKFKKITERLKRQLNQLNSRANKNTTDIVVRISADVKMNAKLFLSYVVSDAGWTPIYDIRSKGSPNPVDIAYKGNVWQLTGNDWNNIMLTLSTGNPSLNNTAPSLTPWTLRFKSYRTDQRYMSNRSYEIEEAENDAMPMSGFADNDDDISARLDVRVSQGTVNTEFKIETPYTIARVTVNTMQLRFKPRITGRIRIHSTQI